MKCRISIEAKDRKQARLIAAGLERPDVRAFAAIVATLDPLSNSARARILQFVWDQIHDKAPSVRPVAPAPNVEIPIAVEN